MLLTVTTIRFLCFWINAEARTTQKRAALCRLYVFLRQSLHAGNCTLDCFHTMLAHLKTVENVTKQNEPNIQTITAQYENNAKFTGN